MKRLAGLARFLILAQCLLMLSTTSHALTMSAAQSLPSLPGTSVCHVMSAIHKTTDPQGLRHTARCTDCAVCAASYLQADMRDQNVNPAGACVMTPRMTRMQVDTSAIPERKPPRA